MIIEDLNSKFYIDGYLKKNLDIAKEMLIKNFDNVFCVDGYEGTGKSTLAIQVCKYMDPTFNVDRIVFTPKQFDEAIDNAQKKQAILYDEAITGANVRRFYSETNKTLIDKMVQIRQKNLVIGFVAPTFFDLDKYIAIWRTKFLLHVYLKSGTIQRGHFSFYNEERKKNLWVYGKKIYSYKKTAPNFIGSFTSSEVIDNQLYLQKKLDALAHSKEIQKHPEELYKKMYLRLKELHDLWVLKIYELGIKQSELYRWAKEKNKTITWEELVKIKQRAQSQASLGTVINSNDLVVTKVREPDRGGGSLFKIKKEEKPIQELQN